MKIGIITHYYKSSNYGGNLQAYALCKVLQKYKDVEDVKQICFKSINNKKSKLTLKKCYRFIKYCINKFNNFTHKKEGILIKQRIESFEHFNQQVIPHTEKIYNEQNIVAVNDIFDVFITGSDQVWSLGAICAEYLLEFVNDSKIKFSYAASTTDNILSCMSEEELKKALASFEDISIREQHFVDFVKSLSSKEVKCVLDPTLLLSRSEWDEISSKRIIEGPYLFCYFLGKNKKYRKLAYQFARLKGLKVVCIPYLANSYNKWDKKFSDIFSNKTSPNDFISLIKYAEYVFTDSFHASVFSQIYQKEFFVFKRDKNIQMFYRLKDNAKLFGIEDRLCDSDEKTNIKYLSQVKKISYENNSYFECRKKESLNFLLNIIDKSKTKIASNIYPKIADLVNCNGCSACCSICPTGSIEMRKNIEGFLYPFIDTDKCIDCKKCDKVCPVLNKQSFSNDVCSSFGVINKNSVEKEKSSSGGFFSIIARFILMKGGIVFGASFSDDFKKVVHVGVEKEEDLYKLQTSKYVQSEIGDTYLETKAQLEKGRLVLFTGTPCQIGGLKAFLGKEYDNLYTQDLICHGVPSPLVWEKYVEYREKQANSKTKKVSFRDKTFGWKSYALKILYTNGDSYIKESTKDVYLRLFVNNITLRESCYNCSFKTKNRQSDFTLADFWGVEEVKKSLFDEKGTSLVILHSKKAHKLFDLLKDEMIVDEVDIDLAVSKNSSMLFSVSQNENRKEFFSSLDKLDFNEIKKQFLNKTFKSKIKKIIKKIIKR